MCNPNPNLKMDFFNPYPARHFLCFVKTWLILIDNLFSRNVWTVTVKKVDVNRELVFILVYFPSSIIV